MEALCKLCNKPSSQLCSCNYSTLCSTCIPNHLKAFPLRVHCFQQAQSFTPHYQAVLKTQVKHMSKIAIRKEIENIEHFKQNYLKAIDSRTELVVSQIHEVVNSKVLKFQQSVALAKQSAENFSNKTEANQTKTVCLETNILLRNCERRGGDLEGLPLFDVHETVSTYEAELSRYCNAHLVFPSRVLQEITNGTLRDICSYQSSNDNDCNPDQERHVVLFKERGAVCVSAGAPYTEVISFISQREIFITAVVLAGGVSISTACVLESLEIRVMNRSQGVVIYEHPCHEVLGYNKAGGTSKVILKSAVRIIQDLPCTIRAVYRSRDAHYTFHGSLPSHCDGVSFTFITTKMEGGDVSLYKNSLTTNSIAGFCFNFTGKLEVSPSRVTFAVKKATQHGQIVVVAGSHHMLGRWDPAKGLSLAWSSGDVWRGTFITSEPFTFKYVCVSSDSTTEWKSGPNYSAELTSSLSFDHTW